MWRGQGDAFAIKVEIEDPFAETFTFLRQKTMYGGKRICSGDVIYIFASETEGGGGLIARGVVTRVAAVPRRPGPERQTPRIDLEVRRAASARQSLGRSDLKMFRTWDDGRPETELNFKFYRQATNKVVVLSDVAAAFLASYFRDFGT